MFRKRNAKFRLRLIDDKHLHVYTFVCTALVYLVQLGNGFEEQFK